MRWRSPSDPECLQLDSDIPEKAANLRLVGEFGHIQPEGKCESCFSEATQLCCYSGEFFCDQCFDGAREHFIPSRILNGNFQKGLVAPKHLNVLHALWGTYSVRLPSHLLKQSRSFKRYASAKRSYLVLRQILRLRPRKNDSEASSIGSSFDSSTEGESEDQFPCRHGEAFRHFDNLPWVRPSEDYFTMQEITVAAQSSQIADALEKACQLVRTDLANCCFRVRRNSIGDRCDDEVKCFACQSEQHLCNRRSEHNGKHLSKSLALSRRRVSWSPSPVSVPLGGIAARRAANAELQRQDRANSWLRRGSAIEASRAGFAAVQLKTLSQFIAEREQKKLAENSGLAKSV